MVKLNKIYTKTGDAGMTGLVGGRRVRKDHRRVEAYGAVDEANSFIGFAAVRVGGGAAGRGAVLERVAAVLAGVQNDLFDVGADLATPRKTGEKPGESLRVTAEQVGRLEPIIDEFIERLMPLRSFVIPGGSELAAALHVARAMTRRAERCVVTLTRAEPKATSGEPGRYLNRLSDLLFVMARVANDDGRGDVLWKPGASRGG